MTLSVLETTNLLEKTLGRPIKSVAYAKGFRTRSGKVLAIHPIQKTPRIWHQPPAAPEISGIRNIDPAKNDDLVGELSILQKGHGTPRVQIETEEGLAEFLRWYDRANDMGVGAKNELFDFETAYLHFQDLLHRRSAPPFTGFDEGLIAGWENYKPRLRDLALDRLAPSSWQEEKIGSGEILNHVIEAIEIQAPHGDLTNNLVFWQNRFGHANRDHKALLEARDDARRRNEMEGLLFDFFQDRAEDANVFEALADATQRKYPLVAYLFFLKDIDRYMPIQPTGFDRVFRQMGVELRTLRNCSWQNYSEFNGLLGDLRSEISRISGLKNVRLIDAHSFLWVYGTLLKELAEGTLDGGSGADGFLLGAQEKSIIEIKHSVLDTVSKSNGQVAERKVKNKELHMSDAELEKRIRKLLEIQEGRCAITGLPFQFRGRQDDENMLPSLDRIDSDGHYSAENVQLVCRFINFWKQASPDDEFRRLINLVRGL